MPKAKKKRRHTYNYNIDRKKLKRKAKKKSAPRIPCDPIRNAWDNKKCVARNLADMGLAIDPNKSLPISKNKEPQVDETEQQQEKVIYKPYVIEGLQALANLPSKQTMGISSDMIHYVRYMIENYGEDYKVNRIL
ncbi:hypothetical protein GDO86_005518 [Hymenochirus boettgeri]|uniref:Nucleolar protein 16 n=1 Tax=Hymenochirus boettgeri TaxID=247094 RepID=A0A8T2J4S5_9PIPI|nr:hypothetical protein GDO86_005518 [Hymenochirus boettgeri]